MITTQRRHNIPAPRDLARQPRDGAGDLVDFGEEDDSWEFGGGVVRDGGVVEEDALFSILILTS